MFFDFPNFLKLFSAKFTFKFLFVNFPFFTIVNMSNVSGNVVAVQEFFTTYIAFIIPLPRVRFLQRKPLELKYGI